MALNMSRGKSVAKKEEGSIIFKQIKKENRSFFSKQRE